MSDNNPEQTPLTKSQQDAALEFERFVSELIGLRRPAKKETPTWLKVLDSAGAVAFITVVIGGAFTTYITDRFSQAAKDRDFQNEIVKIYSQRKLEEQFKERTAALKESASLVGSSIERADSRVAIDGRLFAPRIDPKEEALNAAQKRKIRDAFNDQEENWNAQKGALRARLQSQLGPGVSAAWEQVTRNIDVYMDCAATHIPANPDPACGPPKKSSEAALDEFFRILTDEMRKSWISQEDVAQIRKALAYPEEHDQAALPWACAGAVQAPTSGHPAPPQPRAARALPPATRPPR